MLQAMGSSRVGHKLATEQQQLCVCVCVCVNHFAVHLKLTQHYKSTIFQLKNNKDTFAFLVTWPVISITISIFQIRK